MYTRTEYIHIYAGTRDQHGHESLYGETDEIETPESNLSSGSVRVAHLNKLFVADNKVSELFKNNLLKLL